MEALKEADNNVDPDGLVQNIPLVAFLTGKPELLDTLYESVLQLQTNDMMVGVVMMASRLLERYILNSSMTEEDEKKQIHPIEQVISDLKDPGRKSAEPLDLAMASHLDKVLKNRALSNEDASAKFGVR